VLAELTPNEGDLSVKHLGGVRRPAPSACVTRAQRMRDLRPARARYKVTYNNSATSKRTRRVSGLGPPEYRSREPAPDKARMPVR
jgi:hypothetical protein